MKLEEHLGGHCNVTHIDEGALDYLLENFNIETAYDLGCGPGGMVETMIKRGISCLGIDGDYSITRSVPCEIIDFTKNGLMPPRASLCWSVEFLEHVEEKFMENYLPVLMSCNLLMLTASPSEKGHHHVNVHNCDWWISKISSYGFRFLDKETQELRARSTMKRDFVRTTGMVFTNEYRR